MISAVLLPRPARCIDAECERYADGRNGYCILHDFKPPAVITVRDARVRADTGEIVGFIRTVELADERHLLELAERYSRERNLGRQRFERIRRARRLERHRLQRARLRRKR